MLETVFRFPLPTVQVISGKSCKLPHTVCPQCSSTVRNFYSFTKLTEASQKKLLTECMGTDSSTFDELLQYVKAEPDDGIDASDIIDNNVSSQLSFDTFVPNRENGSKLTKRKPHLVHSNSHSLANKATSDEEPSYGCDEEEVAKSIAMVENRMDTIATKMDWLLERVGSSGKQQFRIRHSSFQLTPVNSNDELISLNSQLKDEEYMEKVLGWLDLNVTAVDSASRMHQALDMVFTRTFLSGCSWTGLSSKGEEKKNVAIRIHTNVLELFRLIGSTNVCKINLSIVTIFFMKKLHHVKSRAVQAIRKSSCRSSFLQKP
ncbi:uncharacterized protein LOC131266443 isoform X2 [Anopheles coustani]|uniref:uncharacterized protein LOC131266443 isoform X2 n=1 Tax=Anopheles coustani TaxID=139045 RepID=UPI002657FEF8|nr:uncharacterized protein LOC131266443 isoform X2 [Anopheles coustani]